MKASRIRAFRLLALMATVLFTPAVALAHGMLKSSSPAVGSHVSTVPIEIRLTFTEATDLAYTRIELFGPDSLAIALGPVAYADGDAHLVVVAAIRGALAEGTYTVHWQMTGADGHPVRDRFTFMIMSGAAGVGVTAPGQAAPAATQPAVHHDPATMPDNPGFDVESPLYVAIRWLTFTALVVALGAVAFHLFVLGLLGSTQQSDSPMLAPASTRAAGIAVGAVVLLGVAAVLRLYAQSYALHGPEGALDPSLIATLLGRTTWGWAWMLQAAGVIIAAVGFLAARQGRRSGWTIAALAMTALAFTPALSGHAVAVPELTSLAILADGLHVIGASGWLGSLLFVVAVGIPAARRLPEGLRGRGVADLINAFSPTALVFAGTVALTGVVSAWFHLNALSDLWRSDYGQTLLLKLGILSIVAATGAYNWRRVKPTLGGPEGAARIRRSSMIELAVGVVVLLVTAVLVATPTPMDTTMADSAAMQGAERAPLP